MTYVLGTDEAGYGPNLGPLVIAASAWSVPHRQAAEALYELLAAVITADPNDAGGRLAIGDSKRLYRPGGSLAALERGVLTALALLDRKAGCWREIWRPIDPEVAAHLNAVPWHDGFDEPLPLDGAPANFGASAAAVHDGCTGACVQLTELQASVIFPEAFNAAVCRSGNKAEVLSLTTLRLASRVLRALPDGPAIVLCDKHGGRNHYTALLQHVFPERLVLVRKESAELSIYQVHVAGRDAEVRFQPKAERHLPTALASMTAKYLRELAMRPFNAFWQRHVPDLRPTAGYPADSRRFLDDIRAAKERLGIADHVLWRER